MSVPNLLGLVLRPCELEIRSDILAQLAFHKQVLPPVVLTRVTFGKYAAVLVRYNNCTNFAQNQLDRLYNVLTRLINILSIICLLNIV